MKKNLPAQPNLEFLLREAQVLKSSHRAGDASVCRILGHFDTSLHGLSTQQIIDRRFSILDAQRVVARQYGFSSWGRLKKHVLLCRSGKNPSDLVLRQSLFSRNEALNTLAEECRSRKGDFKGSRKRYHELSLEIEFLDRAFDSHGWPGPDVVGSDCLEALLNVSANAVYDAGFQERSTRLMGESLSEGRSTAYWYAQLRDRYLVLSSKPSVYGSFFGAYRDDNNEFKLMDYEVEDPENLEKRRARVGLESVDELRQQLTKSAAEENWSYGTYDQAVKEQRQVSIEGGYLTQ